MKPQASSEAATAKTPCVILILNAEYHRMPNNTNNDNAIIVRRMAFT